MTNCPKCGQQIEQDARFCDSCGAEIQQENQTTNCSAAAENTAAVENTAEANATPAEAAAPEQSPGKSVFKRSGKTAIITAAVIAVLVVVLVLSTLLSTLKHPADGIIYLRDGELEYVSSSGKNVLKLTDEMNLTKQPELDTFFGNLMAISPNGKRIFYVDHTNKKIDFDLYYRDLDDPKGDANKVDSNVVMYQIDDAGKNIIYLKADKSGATKLFRTELDKDNKIKIKDGVLLFYASANLNKVIFLTCDRELYSWSGSEDCTKLASDVTCIDYVDDKLSRIYYEKNDALYKHDVQKDEREKITSDIVDVVHVYDKGEMYYLTRIDEDEKEYALHYYDGKESTLLSEKVDGGYASFVLTDTDSLFTPAYSMNQPKVLFQEILDSENKMYMASGPNVVEMKSMNEYDFQSDSIYHFSWSADGNTLYYVDHGDDLLQGDIYRTDIVNGKVSSVVPVDTDASVFTNLEERNGKLTYCKNITEVGLYDYADLYVEGQLVDYDVLIDYQITNYWLDDRTLLYCTDWDEEERHGTLKTYRNGKKERIADEVYDFIFTEDGAVFYLADRDKKSYTGTLYRYKNGKTIKVADDVEEFMPMEYSTIKKHALDKLYGREINKVHGYEWLVEECLKPHGCLYLECTYYFGYLEALTQYLR